jgi:hypothetical protein
MKKVLDYFGTTLTDEWSDDCDFYIYQQESADGYELYIATKNPFNINVSEDVYSYDTDLAEVLSNVFKWEKCDKIHIDDLDAYWLEEVFGELSDWIDINEQE